MPEYLHPGVYIEETSYRGKPIQGVGTSTAGFVGACRKGPEGTAVFIPNYPTFRRIFGDPITAPGGLGDYLGHSVKAFFDNGGPRCYVVRALSSTAVASSVALEQGIALKLAPGVAVRGRTRTLRLNALRGVGVNTVLDVYTRPDANSPFTNTRSLTVESYDALRNSVTVDAPSEIPSGVVLDPGHTVLLIAGGVPANAAAAGGGAVFTARHRGIDGDRISVEIRPRDRAPVALSASFASRATPLIDVVNFPLAPGGVDLELTQASLARVRVGDQISIGGSRDLAIQSVLDGSVTFDVSGGGAGQDHSGGADIALITRDGTVLDTPVPLGAAPAAFAADLQPGGTFGPAALPHDLAALLEVGDVVQITAPGGGAPTTDVDIQAVSVAPGGANNVMLAAPGMTTAEVAGAEARVTETAAAGPVLNRIHVGEASGFAAPQRAGSPATISITDGSSIDMAQVMLVEPATNTLYLAAAAGQYPDTVAPDAWLTAENLQALAVDGNTVRVATTAPFYTGANVELDTGSAKFEGVVASIDGGARTVTLAAAPPLDGPVDLPADPGARNVYLRTCEIDVVIHENGVVSQVFEGLTWNPDTATDAGLRYFVSRINDPELGSDLVSVAQTPPPGPGFAQAPCNGNGQPKPLAGGDNGPALTELDLIGSDNGPGRRTGIQALGERRDISIVAVPGVTAEAVQGALLTHCERLKYRIAVLDAPLDALDVTEIQSHRNNYDSLYGAYYGPWLRALNSASGRIESFPPSGHVAGIYGRSDNNVGVHKAPANEVVRNITDVVLPFTDAEQDVLNPIGVNLIRDLTPRGIRVWGARTISSDQEWKYVNIRRLFIFLEHSIDNGTQWVVFEPNGPLLWDKVVTSVSAFLTTVWKSGALFGSTPEQAFFVRCDETTMTQDDLDNGRLICEIGIAPLAPAEFVIFRIGQATLTE